MADTFCRTCRQRIVYEYGIGWVHVSGRSRWCDPTIALTDTSEASPDRSR